MNSMLTQNFRMKWEQMLANLTPDEHRAMAFLRDHLPESDLDCYPPELFLQFAGHALALREKAAWCGALDWEIFAHYVLFPRVNDEDLSFHRAIFHDALWPRVRDLPSAEARVLEVNRWCHEHASYQAQDERTASPLTVFRCGSGRCGEESAFLVSALRSVGIPARQVYAPRWSHCDDNHAWVEALCGDTWRFLGACEPEPVLDRGWFITAASRAMLVHSRIFGEGASPLHGHPLGREGAVSWFSQTARYAKTRPCTFRALAGGQPAAGAKFYLQVLNEASFHTIAVLTADAQGTARAELGCGSLHVFASLGSLSAGGECGEDGIVLHLAPPEEADTPWQNFDFSAPADGRLPPAILSDELKRERAETLRRGNLLRQKRLDGFPGTGDLLRRARGNSEEICAFLNGPDAPSRERLVRTLTDKDLRDTARETLEDHFAHLPPRRPGVPEDVYWQYTACPRVALEKLTPWRQSLSGWLADWTGSPEALWNRLEGTLEDVRENLYSGLYWTPEAALAAGRCDEKSRRVLFAAALRTLGIPARLRPMDGAPEIWEDGGFRPLCPERTGLLRLIWAGEGEPLYRQNWTLSRWEGDGWRLLELSGENIAALVLPAGRYRLTAASRLPGGDQLASRLELTLRGGEERSIRLCLRPCSLDDMLSRQTLPPLSAVDLEGRRVPDIFRWEGDGRPLLALWLEEGGEPTEHILNELTEQRQSLEALPLRVLFLLRGRESLRQPTLARALACLPGVQVLLDDWAYDLEAVARHLGRDPDSPPLAVVCDSGEAVYSDCGYRVGAAELLVRVAAQVCHS